MIVLLFLISTVCSCVHKNADKEVWKDLPACGRYGSVKYFLIGVIF